MLQLISKSIQFLYLFKEKLDTTLFCLVVTPTSAQPKSQSKNASGREYTYEVPKRGGGTELKSVQQQTLDRSHKEQPHWEAGKIKIRENKIQYNPYNRAKLETSKSKTYYKNFE